MSRKVYVNIKACLIIDMDEGVEVEDVLSDIQGSVYSDLDGADVCDFQISNHEVTDSK